MIGKQEIPAESNAKRKDGRRYLYVALPVIDVCLLLAVLLRGRLSALLLGQPPVCPARAIGLLCGSCGATRCFVALLHGDFAQAFSFNPLFFLVAVYAALILIAAHVFLFSGKRFVGHPLRFLVHWKAAVAFAVLWATFTVLRNIV